MPENMSRTARAWAISLAVLSFGIKLLDGRRCPHNNRRDGILGKAVRNPLDIRDRDILKRKGITRDCRFIGVGIEPLVNDSSFSKLRRDLRSSPRKLTLGYAIAKQRKWKRDGPRNRDNDNTRQDPRVMPQIEPRCDLIRTSAKDVLEHQRGRVIGLVWRQTPESKTRPARRTFDSDLQRLRIRFVRLAECRRNPLIRF